MTRKGTGERVRVQTITSELLLLQGSSVFPVTEEDLSGLPRNAAEHVYPIGPADILTIVVWDHPELTIPAGQFRSAEEAGVVVDENGEIFYPYAGRLRVAGLTTAQIADLLTRTLADVIQNPQVDVRVAAFRSQRAYVVGQVNVPGPQPITDVPLTVVEAIGRAGDVTEEADLTNVQLTRDGTVYRINLVSIYEEGDLSGNVLLEAGDVLNVVDNNLQKVFVLGAVVEPTSQRIHKGRLTLAEAISDAGGIDQATARAADIYVIRGTPSAPTIYHLDGRSPDALILGDHFRLQPRDIVYVETATSERLRPVLSNLSLLATTIYGLDGRDR